MELILEVGLNHFGKVSESKKYLNFFLKSDFKFLTYQIQKENFYNNFNFKLSEDHYKFLIKKVHKKKKKIGLAVADIKSCLNIAKLNFDFYKILSISFKDKDLIDFILKFKKPVFISCGTATNNDIKKCISNFNSFEKKKITLIHTSFSYQAIDQNLKRIDLLKNYHSQISYGHHYKNYLPIILLKCMKIQYAFVYIKSQNSKKRMYPDNIHAFSFEKIIFLKDMLTECNYLLGSKKKSNYYNKIINEKKISF